MALTLPSRDYYLKANSQGDMEAYHRLMTRIALLLGADSDTARDELQKVIDFEKKLANVRRQLRYSLHEGRYYHAISVFTIGIRRRSWSPRHQCNIWTDDFGRIAKSYSALGLGHVLEVDNRRADHEFRACCDLCYVLLERNGRNPRWNWYKVTNVHTRVIFIRFVTHKLLYWF